MIERKIYIPRCSDCEHHIYYNSAPKKVKGIILYSGNRYCTGGKKPKRFANKDPKVYVPKWCPLKKSPAILRIYHFIDVEKSLFWYHWRKSEGLKIGSSEFEYALSYEGTINMDAKIFFQASKEKKIEELLGIDVSTHDVIEIDDGLEPYYFYVLGIASVELIYFNGAMAREHKLKEVEIKLDSSNATNDDEK